MLSTVSMVMVASFVMAAADPSACEKAFLDLLSEDACGNENGPDASKACSSVCKPLACAMVSACPAGSTIQVEDETGKQTIPAEGVQSFVEELSAEHTACPCSASRMGSQPNKTVVAKTSLLAIGSSKKSLRQAEHAEPSACDKAFFDLLSEDACGNENGPDASKACSSVCKPLACAMVSACPAGSTIQVEDETGKQTIPAEGVQSFVEELSAEHIACPCTASRTGSQPNKTVVAKTSLLAIGGSKKSLRQAEHAEPSACDKAFFDLLSEDACGNENGPDASKACSSVCKPLACAMVSACPAGSTIQVEDETGKQTIPAEGVQSFVEELSAEHIACPCKASRMGSQPNKTVVAKTSLLAIGSSKKSLRQAEHAEPSACDKAFFDLLSEDACGNENGPDASKACSSVCKPLACAMVSACPAGSTIQVEDETGKQTIPAEGVQSFVEELSAEHTACPCSAARSTGLRGGRPPNR